MTAVDFRTAFPEFEPEHDSVINRWIANADPEIDFARWGNYYARGIGNWVGHQIVMEKRRIAAGPQAQAGDVLTKTIESPAGRVSVSRGAGSVAAIQGNSFLESAYGKEYWRLLQIVGSGALAI